MSSPRIPLDAFVLCEPLARGGMGLVFRGEHRELGTPVAIKVLSHARARHERAIASFAREVRAMASLDHPAIVRVLDHGVIPPEAAAMAPDRLVQGSPYLVMELAYATLDTAPPARSWPRLVAVLLSLLDALAHAHARGLVHRDLKPANVLRVRLPDGSSMLKLSDFGLAHVIEADPADEYGAAAGTPQMMAPEQFRGLVRDFGPWTDLYALGCIAHKLACGRPPFDDPDEQKLAELHLRAAPPPLVPTFAVSPGFAGWVARLLEKAPEARFARAADAAWALKHLPPPTVITMAEPLVLPHGASTMPALHVAIGSSSDGESREERWPFASLEDASITAPREELRIAPSHEVTTSEPEETAVVIATFIEAADEPEDSVKATLKTGRPTPPERPPVPSDWRRPPTPVHGLGTALSLYSLRAPPFVAREKERDECWRALRRVSTTGVAEAIVLRGASGFGKTRLAEWLAERAHEVGAATPLLARHEAMATADSGLVGMLASHFRTAGLARSGALLRVRRALAAEDAATCEAVTEMIAARGASAHNGGPDTSARSELVARVLEALARDRTLIVTLDDAHVALPAIALVEHMLAAQGDSPAAILFVLTVEDESLRERPMEYARLASLLARDDVREVDIGPLPPDDHALLVATLLGQAGPLASEVAERTAGHALFAVQLVGDWVERGVLEPGPYGLRVAPGVQAVLPEDLHAVWAARLAHLLANERDDARLALELAACAGRRVRTAELQAACASCHYVYPDELFERLQERRLLGPLGDDEGKVEGFEFVHELLRETLVRDAADAGRLKDHHLAHAQALEARFASKEPHIAERLAGHFLAAGEEARALAPLVAAAMEHHDRAEYGAAEALLDRHAALASKLGLASTSADRLEADIARAEVKWHRGRLDEASELASAIWLAADAAALPSIVARALYLIGHLDAQRGDLRRGQETLEKAHARFSALGDRAAAARCLRALGWTRLKRGERASAYAAYEQALSLASDARDTLGMAASLSGMGQSHPSGPSEEHHHDALVLFERAGNLYGVGATLDHLGDMAREGGDLLRAEELYGRALSTARKIGAGQQECLALMHLGVVRVSSGRYGEAWRELLLGCRRAERLGQNVLLATMHALCLPCAADGRRWDAWDFHDYELRRLVASIESRDEELAWAVRRGGQLAIEKGDPLRGRRALALAEELTSPSSASSVAADGDDDVESRTG